MSYLKRRNNSLSHSVGTLETKLEELTEKYNQLVEYTRPFVEDMRRFPEVVKNFLEKLLPPKEQQREQEIEKPKRKNRDDWSR